MAQTVEELLTEIDAVKKAQKEHEKTLLDEIKSLKEEVAELKDGIIPKLKTQLNNIADRQKVFTMHLNQLYAAQTIEQQMEAMTNVAKTELLTNECKIYRIDPARHQIFTLDENGDRSYIEAADNSYLEKALRYGETTISNDYVNDSAEIGDGQSTASVHNVAVIPMESSSGVLIGVVVAKNKTGDFTKDDVSSFDFEEGKIGSAFRVGFENKYLKELAETDMLTGLHNRLGLDGYLKNVAYDEVQNNQPLSMAVIDIDNFKTFNDAFGHETGDEVLKQVADVIRDNIRPDEEAARWGGEEIVVVAKRDETEMYQLAEKIRTAIASTPLYVESDKEQAVQVTVSLGVAGVDSRDFLSTAKSNMLGRFEATVFKEADERLYEAKSEGKNITVASPEFKRIDKANYDIQAFERAGNLQEISSSMLVDEGTVLAKIATQERDGLTAYTEFMVSGKTEIYYGEDYYSKPSEFPEDLISAIQLAEWDTMTVISESHIEAKTKVINAENDVVYQKTTQLDDVDFSRMTNDEIREMVANESIQHIVEANKELKTLSELTHQDRQETASNKRNIPAEHD